MRRSTFGMMMVVAALGCDEGDGGKNPGPDGGNAPSELDCPGFVACVEACTAEPCVQACVDAASQPTLTIVSAVLDCVETHGCGEDDACIAANCSSEIAACGVDFDPGEIEVPPPDDDFPLRVTGTLEDDSPLFLHTRTTAEVTFVRDEAGGAASGFPVDDVVAYRMESVTYRATRTGTIGTCTYAADETETFTFPPQLGNHLVIERATAANGQHVYTVDASLSVIHPQGDTVSCVSPPSVTMSSFEAGLYVASRPLEPTSDLVTFQGSKDAGGGRTMSWNLHAVE